MRFSLQRNLISFCIAFFSILFFVALVIVGDYDNWVYPLLIGASLCSLLRNSEDRDPGTLVRRRCHSRCQIFVNDANHNLVFICSVFVAAPCFIFFSKRVVAHAINVHGSKLHEKLANDLGLTAATAMAYFLIPVSKQTILMKAVGIGEIHALRLHIWGGYIAVFGGCTHGLYYLWIWFVHKGESLWNLIPDEDCLIKEYDQSCHSRFVNLLGMVCGVCFMLLGFTSLWWVRRKYYTIFYRFHVGLSLVLLFALMMHYNKMILFLSPSLLYYTSSNVPIFIENLKKLCQGGVKLSKVSHIPHSGGCVELSFASHGYTYSKQALCGKYIKLCVPCISTKSHPFSVFSDPNQADELKIIFRSNGNFTSKLSNKLLAAYNTPTKCQPRVLINGLYEGSDQWKQALQHERILIIVGGVGIVSYISLLEALGKHLGTDSSGREISNAMNVSRVSKRVEIHWICRQKGLVEYVIDKYLSNLQISDECLEFIVYHTADANDVSGNTMQDGIKPHLEYSALPSNATLSSAFDGNGTFFQNVLSACTFMAISWVGLWVIKFCYNNLQEKHVFETRSISVICLIVVSIIISFLSISIKESCCFQSDASFSRLKSDENHIECGKISVGSAIEDSIAENDTPELLNSRAFATFGHERRGIIFHRHGRPDITSLVHRSLDANESDAINLGVDHSNVGLFVCGPRALSESTRRAVKAYIGQGHKKAAMCLRFKGPVIYEEVYEI